MRRAAWMLGLVVALWLCAASALAEPAAELSGQCAFAAEGKHEPFARLVDGGYRNAFTAERGALELAAPEGTEIGWLYLSFGELPNAYVVEAEGAAGWQAVDVPANGFAHVTIPIPGARRARVRVEGTLSLLELRVFTAGELPEDVQQWRPTSDKADLLLLVAHPDDEFIFFGGMAPWYVSQGRRVLVATMTCRTPTRRAELLNGLWRAGLREYPVIGGFQDRSTRSLKRMYDVWTREEADCYVVELIRRYRPEVLVTHDVKGEYGHGAHMACADIALRMFDKTADPMYLPQVSARLGTWQVKKLYLHLWRERPLHMDWTRDVGGESAIERAEAAFALHVSQQHFTVQSGRNALYDCAAFGLARTVVGEDEAGEDLFEHLAPMGACGAEASVKLSDGAR